MAEPRRVQVRIKVPDNFEVFKELLNSYIPLLRIDFFPPASGPEFELTFGTSSEPLALKVCKEHKLHVLAARTA